MSVNGAALPQAKDCEIWRVVHFCARGPLGETLLDPVHAELLFLSKWRPHLPLRFEESRYSTVAALGPLPVAVTNDGIISREDLRAALAALDPDGYGAAADESFSCLLDRLGLLTSVLLYEDKTVWETYTRPTLTQSSPPGFGWAAAMAEQRRQVKRLREEQFFHEPLNTAAVLVELRSVLEAVSDRLDGNGSFGGSVPELSSLDARTYAQLVVLLSIPCRGSSLEKVLADFPALSRYVGCIEERLPGTWPDYSTFLQALSPDERPPPPPQSTFQSKSAVTMEQGRFRNQEWWEIWGWSWGGRKRPVQFSGPGKSPPAVYAVTFGIVSGMSFLAAILCGLGPNKPLTALRRMLLSETQASEQAWLLRLSVCSYTRRCEALAMARREHSSLSKGILAALLVATLWTASSVAGAVAFAFAGARLSRDQSLVTRYGGRDWHAGNVLKKIDFQAAAAQAQARAAKKKKEAASGVKKRPEPPTIHKASPVYYNGDQVAQLNGTMTEYKVDIWSGVHPAWQGRKGKVVMDNSALTKFQEKFGMAADVYGEQGMEQVKANEERKKKQEEMAAAGLKVY